MFFLVLFLLFLSKRKIIIFVCSSAFLGIVSSLRYNFGADYNAYGLIFNSISSGQIKNFNIEPLYGVYNIIVHSIGLNYVGFVAFNTFLLLLLFILWIIMSSDYQYYSFFVYVTFFFLVWNLSTFRQSLALSLGVLLIYNRKLDFNTLIKFLIIPILSMFHFSAYFFGVLILVGSLKWNKKSIAIFFAIGLLYTFLPTQEILAQLIHNASLDGVYYIAKVRGYFDNMEFSFGFFNVSSLMRIFFFILVWAHYEVLRKTKYLQRITNVFLVGMTLYLFLSFNALFASRLTIYALILLVILLPEILAYYEEKKPWMRIAAMSVFIGLCTFMYFKDLYAIKDQLGIDDGKWYVEYQSILDQDIIIEK